MKEKEEKTEQSVCPECLQPTTEEELNTFGGICEDCAFIEED